MKNKRHKILVLGATGFIGRNILEKISKNKNYKIYAINFNSDKIKIPDVIWYKCDLRNPLKIKKILKGTNIVIQAAATTSGSSDIVNRPYIHATDNAVMNSYILREIYNLKIQHFIFFSCTVMYHSSKKALKEQDFNPNKNIFPKYFGVAHTKLFIEKMCEFYSQICETKFTIIRHSNIYGQYDKFDLNRSHFFGATISKVMKSQNKIIVWGEGKEKRDLLHVNDLVNFVEKVIKNQKNNFEIFNVGSGKAYSVKEIVKKIIKISGKNIQIQFDKSKPNIKTSLFLDYSKSKKLLNWYPKVSIEEGIISTIKWWKKNIDIKTLKIKK